MNLPSLVELAGSRSNEGIVWLEVAPEGRNVLLALGQAYDPVPGEAYGVRLSKVITGLEIRVMPDLPHALAWRLMLRPWGALVGPEHQATPTRSDPHAVLPRVLVARGTFGFIREEW